VSPFDPSTPAKQGIPKPADAPNEEGVLVGKAIATYFSGFFEVAPTSSALSKRASRAALAGVPVRQAAYTRDKGKRKVGAKASNLASRYAVAATMRKSPTGWAPNLLRILSDEGFVAGSLKPFVTEQDEDAALLSAAFAVYEIDPGAKGALLALKNAIIRGRAEFGEGFPEMEYTPAPRITRFRSAKEGYGSDFAPEDVVIAQLNPRRNPDTEYAKFLQAYLAGEGISAEFPDAAPLDFKAARAAFPTRFKSVADQKEAPSRLGQHGGFVQFKKRPPLESFELGAEDTAGLESQAGLSLPETRQVLRRLGSSYERRQKTTIPVSSALCAVNRVKKLKDYRVGSNFLSAGAPGYENKKVVIWVSPTDLPDARVMMFRRNTHIDCDIPVGMARSVGQALAIAMQDVLLWLGQRESRVRDTYVYVGQVGEPGLNLIWKPGLPLSYSAMMEQLKNPRGNIEIPDYNGAADLQNYKAALSGVRIEGSEVEVPRAAPKTAEFDPGGEDVVVEETAVAEPEGDPDDDFEKLFPDDV
jgi:hypothetical protein